MPDLAPVAALADVAALWGLDGWLTPPLTPVVPARAPLSGVARTVQLVHAASGPGMAQAFEVLSSDLSGQVLVWAGVGQVPGATWGEILASAAQRQGATAVLIDGAVRDVNDMRAMGLPVYASRRAVVGPNATVHAVAVDVPVNVGGVVIEPGDTVVVDNEGCIRLSASTAADVLTAGAKYAAGEHALLEALRAGEPLTSAYLHKKRAVDALRR